MIIEGVGKDIGKATALMFCRDGLIITITGRTKMNLSNSIKEAKLKGK